MPEPEIELRPMAIAPNPSLPVEGKGRTGRRGSAYPACCCSPAILKSGGEMQFRPRLLAS